MAPPQRRAALDAPLDCSGAQRGEAMAPQALRAAGFLDRIGARDAGTADAWIHDASRDPATGVIGAADIRRASGAIAAGVAAIREAGELPVVLGGDCTLLLGVFSGLPPGTALWFIDGHADFYDGDSSPTGEAADMDLAILTGHGPPRLLGSDRVLVAPADVILMGHRPAALSVDTAIENARIDRGIRALTAPEITASGPDRVGREAARRFRGRSAWLHLDLDVLDQSALPAVTYPQPCGLGWSELVALARPLARAEGLAGISIADFNPERDLDGACAARVVGTVAAMLDVGRGKTARHG